MIDNKDEQENELQGNDSIPTKEQHLSEENTAVRTPDSVYESLSNGSPDGSSDGIPALPPDEAMSLPLQEPPNDLPEASPRAFATVSQGETSSVIIEDVPQFKAERIKAEWTDSDSTAGTVEADPSPNVTSEQDFSQDADPVSKLATVQIANPKGSGSGTLNQYSSQSNYQPIYESTYQSTYQNPMHESTTQNPVSHTSNQTQWFHSADHSIQQTTQSVTQNQNVIAPPLLNSKIKTKKSKSFRKGRPGKRSRIKPIKSRKCRTVQAAERKKTKGKSRISLVIRTTQTRSKLKMTIFLKSR